MKFVDPIALKLQQAKEAIYSASYQAIGERETQEDAISIFRDECVAIADGVGGMPHGEIAAQLAAETATWAYKHVRTRPFYWDDKKLFMKRIFRTVNLRVWQKRRDEGFEGGLATTLVVLIIGFRNCWIGSAGDSAAWLIRQGVITKLTHDDRDTLGNITKVIGVQRLGLFPQFVSTRFLPEDYVILATDGVNDWMTPQDFIDCIHTSPEETAKALVQRAQTNGSTDNMSVCVVKKVLQSPSH